MLDKCKAAEEKVDEIGKEMEKVKEKNATLTQDKIGTAFCLNERDDRIIALQKSLEVYEIELQDIQFELFVYEVFEQDSLQHICLLLDDALKPFIKASEKNYWAHLKRGNEKESYFIKDKNNNLFELRTKMQYHEQFIG